MKGDAVKFKVDIRRKNKRTGIKPTGSALDIGDEKEMVKNILR